MSAEVPKVQKGKFKMKYSLDAFMYQENIFLFKIQLLVNKKPKQLTLPLGLNPLATQEGRKGCQKKDNGIKIRKNNNKMCMKKSTSYY